MGRKEGGSLFHQLIHSPSLYQYANRKGEVSFKTRANYNQWLHLAAEYFKGLGIRSASEIDLEKIQEYADHLRGRGLSASTVHSYLAPLCKARGISLGAVKKDIRYAADFKKSGSSSVTDGGAAGALNEHLGLRRSELTRLRGNDVSVGRTGELLITLDRGKGGKTQRQKVTPPCRAEVEPFFDGSDEPLFRRQDIPHNFGFQKQRRENARNALRYYTERLEADPSYRKTLYQEISENWHKLNKRKRNKLEPLSYFDKKYVLRGRNRALAIRQGKPYVLDHLAIRAVSVLHLAHWRDNVTIQSYYFDR